MDHPIRSGSFLFRKIRTRPPVVCFNRHCPGIRSRRANSFRSNLHIGCLNSHTPQSDAQITVDFTSICDHTYLKCQERYLNVDEIQSFLDEMKRSMNHDHRMRLIDHDVWNRVEKSITRIINHLSNECYLAIFSSARDANGVWLWSPQLIEKLIENVEWRLGADDFIDNTGGQFVYSLLDHLTTSVPPTHYKPSFIRALHKHILIHLRDWDLMYMVLVLNKVSFLKPVPPEALVNLFYTESFKSLCDELMSGETGVLTPEALMRHYLDAMRNLSPSPPSFVQQMITEESLKLMGSSMGNGTTMDSNGVSMCSVNALLVPLLRCHHSSVLQFNEQQKNILNRILISINDYSQLRELHSILESYSNFGGNHYSTIVKNLTNQYLSSGKYGRLRNVNTVLEMLRTTNLLNTSDRETLLNYANKTIQRASTSEIVYFISSLAKISQHHSSFDNALEVIRGRDCLTSDQLFRVICSCGKFRNHLSFHKDYITASLSNGLDPEHLQQADLEHLVYFSDALMKHKYHNKAIGELLLTNIFRRESELDLKTMVHSMKACLVIGGLKGVQDVIGKLDMKIKHSHDEISSTDLSFALELLAMLQKTTNDLSVQLIFKMISIHRNEFDGSELGRIFRYMKKTGYVENELVEALVTRAHQIREQITNDDVSWILWSVAKKQHLIPRSIFDHLCFNLINSLKDLDIKTLCRYVYACGSFGYCTPNQLDEISTRICQMEFTRVGLVGTGTLAWTFTKLNYQNNDFLKWLNSSCTPTNVSEANFKSLANIIMALIHFNEKPSDEFLKHMLCLSRGQMHKLSVFEFSTILHGFVKFKFPVSPKWLNEAIEYFERNLISFQRHVLCYTMYSLVELGYHPNSTILDVTTESIHQSLTKIEYNNLARYLLACGKAGYKPISLLFDLEERIKYQADRIHIKTTSALAFSLAMCQSSNVDAMKALAWSSYDHMHKMTPSQLSMFLWGLARGGFYGRRFFNRVEKLVFDKMTQMSGNDLLLTFWAFVRAKHSTSQFTKFALEKFPKHIPNYDSYQLSSFAWALSKIEVYNDEILLALDKTVEAQIGDFSTKALANILHSFATLNYYPLALDLMWTRLDKLGMDPSENWLVMYCVLWSAFKFNKKPPGGILVALEAMIDTQTPLAWKGGQSMASENSDFKPQYLPSVLYCLYGLELHKSKASEKCLERINKIDVLESLDVRLSSFLAQCWLLNSQSMETLSPLSAIPEHYRNKIWKDWETKSVKEMSLSHSKFHQRVRSILQRSGVEFNEMVRLTKESLVIKILLRNPNGSQALAIDMCEKCDFFKNQNTLTGPSLVRQKLLKAAGVRVLSVLDNGCPLSDELMGQLCQAKFPIKSGTIIKESVPVNDSNEWDERSLLEWIDNYHDEFVDQEEPDGIEQTQHTTRSHE